MKGNRKEQMFSGLDIRHRQKECETWTPVSSELGGSCGFYKYEADVRLVTSD